MIALPTLAMLNGVSLLILIVLTIYIQFNTSGPQVPPAYYWLLVIVGLVLEWVSIKFKYTSGQLTAAALHLFIGYVAILSIGALFCLLAVIEIGLAFIQHKRTKKLAV